MLLDVCYIYFALKFELHCMYFASCEEILFSVPEISNNVPLRTPDLLVYCLVIISIEVLYIIKTHSLLLLLLL